MDRVRIDCWLSVGVVAPVLFIGHEIPVDNAGYLGDILGALCEKLDQELPCGISALEPTTLPVPSCLCSSWAHLGLIAMLAICPLTPTHHVHVAICHPSRLQINLTSLPNNVPLHRSTLLPSIPNALVHSLISPYVCP